MPLFRSSYKPSLFFRNAHVHTIYPALFRKIAPVRWQRERYVLPDLDFLDLDWYTQKSNKLVVLGHGLEGSSNSSYILSAAHIFYDLGYDVLAWNHRSCSGTMNLLPRFYHHGVTDDLHAVLQKTAAYTEVFYIGYSLGGNVVLKFLGEEIYSIPKNLKRVVAISAPVDLPSSVSEIHKTINVLYHNRFLKTLKNKVLAKSKLMPELLSASHLKKIKTLTDFDTYYTAPIHGFDSPQDYYQKASSLPYLQNIKVPTLLLQAQDDPMIGSTCYPIEIAEKSSQLHLVLTHFGGHVAFTQPANKQYFMEDVALSFIKDGDLTCIKEK